MYPKFTYLNNAKNNKFVKIKNIKLIGNNMKKLCKEFIPYSIICLTKK